MASARIAYSAQLTQHHFVGKWIKSSLIIFSAITGLSSAFDFMTRRVSGLLKHRAMHVNTLLELSFIEMRTV